ncbi:unnamed protein product, partial [Ectocarpus sp. 12 AP-2014]
MANRDRRCGFLHRPCPRGIRPLASRRRTHLLQLLRWATNKARNVARTLGGAVQTPRASRTKHRAQGSGARLRGSGRRSGKKRQARVKARRSLARLQPQLQQKIADMDYEERHSVAKAEAKARKEREIAEAERQKTASNSPEVRSRRRVQDGKRPRAVADSDGSTREMKPRAK